LYGYSGFRKKNGIVEMVIFSIYFLGVATDPVLVSKNFFDKPGVGFEGRNMRNLREISLSVFLG